MVADHQLDAHDPAELSDHLGGDTLEGIRQNDRGHLAAEQGCAVDYRGALHNGGDAVGQLADGEVDAAEEAHQCADDGAKAAPCAVAFDHRGHQIHQRGVGKGIGGDHAHELQVGNEGERLHALRDAVNLADQQRGGADNHRGDPCGQHIAGGDGHAADRGGVNGVELAAFPILDHVGQAGLCDGDGVDADHAGAGPCQHQQVCVFLVPLRIAARKLGQQVCNAGHVGIAQKEEHQQDDDKHGQQGEENRAGIPKILL